MKLLNIIAIAATAAGLAGCQTSYNAIQSAGSPSVSLAPMATQASYEILGDAKGTSSGAILFGVFKLEGEDKSGSVGMRFLKDPVKDAATYNAIESVPGADAIIATRSEREVTDWIIYKKETVTVKGKAIRYKK